MGLGWNKSGTRQPVHADLAGLALRQLLAVVVADRDDRRGNRQPDRAVEIVAEVTRIPKEVVQVAHRETVQMLHGLTDEQIDTLILQLKLNKEFGFLKSDLWDNPDRIRREFFHRS